MTKERNLNLDLIKIIAMVFVIGMHSIANYNILDININRFYKYTICGSGIPLFFAVSGYLLLGRNNIDWHYSVKKIWGIIKFVFIICWSFWIFRSLFTGIPLWDKLYKDPFGAFLMGGTFWHFWYFGAMCLIYLIYPLVNKVYNENEKLFNTLFICLIAFCSIVYVLNIIIPGTFERKIPQSLRIWNWLLYFSLGGFIKKNNKIIKWKLVLLSSLLYLLQIILVKQMNPSMFNADNNYCSVITLFNVFCIFQALNSLDTHKVSKGIGTLSPLFLPVYTIHTGFIYANPSLKLWFAPFAPVYWLLITIISIGVSWMIMQTKVGKLVFKI